jgi:16S rRNA (uracil1498-N3)-methyltransferase
VTAPHFFVEHLDQAGLGESVALSPQDSRHALRALRLRVGEDVTLADGAGVFARARVSGEREGLALVKVLEVEEIAQPEPAVAVAMAPPKGDRLSWAVQKLAELGVDRVDLLADAERTVRTLEAPSGGVRTALLDRLETVAREARMQSRRPFGMDVSVTTLEAEMESAESGSSGSMMLWEGGTTPMREALSALPPAEEIRLLVGPEGGFADVEIERARAAGLPLVTLGPGILRTETAAVAAAVVALDALGRLGGGGPATRPIR